MSENSRRKAAFAFVRWRASGEAATAMLGGGDDRAFVQDLLYTTIRRQRPLRQVLGEFVRVWPKGELEALLLVGAAQILYMDDVPDFAAVNETVEAAKSCPNPNVAKVTNGVLRNLLRNLDRIKSTLAAAPLAVRESYPNLIVKRWRERFGDENAERLALFHNLPAETFLAWKPGACDEPFTLLRRGCRVSDASGYASGDFIVQDPATSLAVGLVDAKDGESVLDACAAPGGKTIQLAWRGASVTACEVNPRRRKLLAENLSRVGLCDRVRVVGDLGEFETALTLFDKVLVDAPCSNTGVFRRRPDARWNWSEEKLAALVKLQGEILDRAANRVRPLGLLVYSTCSNEREENDEQAAAFLARHPDFEQVGRAESLPFETGHDGAFAASFVRRQRV